MKKPKVKICCISSVEEAHLALKYGADALGLVGHMPSGPGVISDELISTIAKTVPPNTETFLLTSETEASAIVDHHKKVGTSTLQIVDLLTSGDHLFIKESLPGVKIVQVLHVTDEYAIKEAKKVEPWVDALLLDSGNPNLNIKELGGTGKVHNWVISKAIVEQVEIPVYLAGGLNPKNAAKAIRDVNPFGLDLCSGVRTNGHLDEEKLIRFFNAVSKK
jgi:phosphoribosylanthranilate isomerase